MGYFIVDQLPDSERAGKIMKQLENAMGLVPIDERLDLWLGTMKDCSHVAAMKGINPNTIKIINSAQSAVGYKSPLCIHLCGRWQDHAHLRDIKYYFDWLLAHKLADIKFVTEPLKE